MVQGLRGALNALLFRTGDQSRDFAVILATNRPSDLDSAVIDRMDEAIEFPLPGAQEREKILKMYLSSYIAKAGTSEGQLLCMHPSGHFTGPGTLPVRVLCKTIGLAQALRPGEASYLA